MGNIFKKRILWPITAGFAFNLGQAATVTFEADVRPILKAHCFRCHGEDGSAKGGLDVRLHKLLLKGGKHGTAIVPGQAEKSLLYKKIRDGKMPKEQAKLPADQIDTFRLWIEQGAKTARPEPDSPDEWITEEERGFWAFQLIKTPPVPSGAANPIDAFLLRKLKANELGFSREATKRTLIRRATFDLTGLPPTPDEIADFLADETPQAYDQLIDRLLASPNYGERWGRHWLDVAGYADSEGYTESDAERGWAWRYRDYVVRAFNDDLPWDRFIHEQLAGDEMVSPPYANLSPEQIDKLTATGFLRMAPDGTGSGANNAEAKNQVIAETLKIVSTALMGMTVGCAQCHDHRYDPILQSDYYKLRAVFEP
ncbi:MAG: cytochrome c553, partial [Limisphaerales bacterium]